MFATWLIIIGFILSVTGIVLRTILMMRSSDATPREASSLHERELVRQYRQMFPHSSASHIMHAVLICGIAMLCAGVAVKLAQ